jgi:hypothetical protein
MTIKYPINNFLHEIFPTEDRTIDSVKKAITINKRNANRIENSHLLASSYELIFNNF